MADVTLGLLLVVSTEIPEFATRECDHVTAE